MVVTVNLSFWWISIALIWKQSGKLSLGEIVRCLLAGFYYRNERGTNIHSRGPGPESCQELTLNAYSLVAGFAYVECIYGFLSCWIRILKQPRVLQLVVLNFCLSFQALSLCIAACPFAQLICSFATLWWFLRFDAEE